jgi:hypothetical protein
LSESLPVPGPAGRLPIWRLVTLSYVDLRRALRAMPMLFGCAVLIVLAVRVATQLLPHRLESGPIFGTLSITIAAAVEYFCLTPIMIAIHRFIIRGDITRRYTVDLADESFLPFFTWTMVLTILWSLATGASELLLLKHHAGIIGLAIMIVAYAALVWLGLRLIVLFPSIAIQAKGTMPGDAFADTKGHSPRVLAIFVLTLVPLIAAGILVTLVLGHGIMVRGSMLFVIGDIISALIGTLVMALGVVVASHVYLAIGRTVR